jgi:hypothetical protein
VSYRRLAGFPFVLAALGAIVLALAPAAARETVSQTEVDIAKAVALVGLLVAARAFDAGDYLRRGWGLWAFSYAFFLARDATLLLGQALPEPAVDAMRAVLVAAGNVCVVTSAWTLASAWSVAGLEHPGSRGARRAAVGVAVVAAVLFVGPVFLLDVRSLLGGHLGTLDVLASDLGDMLSLPIVAPVALTAIAVRDGTLRWPWALLTSSLLAWLMYDALYAVPSYLAVAPAPIRLVSEQFHVLAGLLACAAGLAQRRAVSDEEDS